MRLPAIAIDQDGLVAEANAAADAIFDDDVRIKNRRIFVRDLQARAILTEGLIYPQVPGKALCRQACL